VNGGNPDPAEFFGVWFDDSNATSQSAGTAMLHSLDWLT
jgi:hypothetical protein